MSDHMTLTEAKGHLDRLVREHKSLLHLQEALDTAVAFEAQQAEMVKQSAALVAAAEQEAHDKILEATAQVQAAKVERDAALAEVKSANHRKDQIISDAQAKADAIVDKAIAEAGAVDAEKATAAAKHVEIENEIAAASAELADVQSQVEAAKHTLAQINAAIASITQRAQG